MSCYLQYVSCNKSQCRGKINKEKETLNDKLKGKYQNKFQNIYRLCQ